MSGFLGGVIGSGVIGKKIAERGGILGGGDSGWSNRKKGLRGTTKDIAKKALADYGAPALSEAETEAIAGKGQEAAGRQVSAIQSELNRQGLAAGGQQGAQTKAVLGLGGEAAKAGAGVRYDADVLNQQLSAQKDAQAIAMANQVMGRQQQDIALAIEAIPALTGATGGSLEAIAKAMPFLPM